MKTVHLEFAGEAAKDLSAIVAIGTDLWLASDETKSITRLVRDDSGNYITANTVDLTEHLDLPIPDPDLPDADEEIDIEGLDFEGGHLWFVGSHSLKRKSPETDKKGKKNLDRLLTVEADGNRSILARLPINGGLAAQLEGGARRSDLSDALRQDAYFQRYFAEAAESDHLRGIAGKDNGLDIEGLAVAGPNRIFIGLRGPVLRGWAVILELQIADEVSGPSAGEKAARMKLKETAPGGSQYRKAFVQLDGLGIRDLCFDGNDLLILAGPSMDLDWPVTVFRWPDARQPSSVPERLIWQKSSPLDHPGDLQINALESIPLDAVLSSEKGKDHAEGMTVIPSSEGGKALLVIYDSPASARLKSGTGVLADVFDITTVA